MSDTKEPFFYTDCGLDNVILQNGYEEIDTPYGKSVSITDVRGLHECIGLHLVTKPAALTGREFRFLRVDPACNQTRRWDNRGTADTEQCTSGQCR